MRARFVAPVLAAMLALAAAPLMGQDAGTVFKIGEAPPPQGVYTKVNLTEPYNIIEGFTIYPSLHSPDLFYYYPKPRVARTKEGRLIFRLLCYAMAENRNQVGSADVAGGYLQFDVTMSPTPEEEKKIKQELLNGPKRFGTRKFGTGTALHPYFQVFGKTAKPKNVRLAPIPIDDLKAKARIPGVLAGDKTDTDWFKANGDASGQTTFAINLSGPQSLALYQAIMEPAAVEPFNVYFEGYIGGYIKCNAYMTVNTSEVFKFMQTQSGSCTKTEIPGKKSVSIFGIEVSKGRMAESRTEEYQNNNIDASTMIGTAIKIGGDLQGYDDALMAMAKYALDGAIARFGTPITLDELMDEKRELQTPSLPTGGSSGSSLWAYFPTVVSTAMFGPIAGGLVAGATSTRNVGRRGYYGYFDQKTLNRANSMSFSVDLNKQIAVEWQFSPSTSIFDDRLVQEIRSNGKMYAQKLALNDPFFEKLDITYGAQLDFAGGPFNKVVFTDIFKLKDGTNYSVPGLLLESKDYLDPKTGQLIGAAPPANIRFQGLLQGNLWQGPMGKSFNILDPAQRRQAYQSGKWPTYADGTQVSGITHQWRYTVYFRPSTRDSDFPSSWQSPAFTNSQTVLLADIPPKVTVITISADALDQNRVKAALVKVKYRARLDHKGKPVAEVIKSAKLRPGGPDKDMFFYDDDPKINKPCEYMYRLLYYGQPTYTSGWIKEEGGWIVLEDPNDVGGAPLATPASVFQSETSPAPVVDDVFF